MNGLSRLVAFHGVRALGLTVIGAALLASCSAGQGGTPSAEPGAGSGSASASGQSNASASPSASSSPNGQLGMIFEVNNIGWQDVLKTPAKRGMAIVVVLPNQPGAKAGLVEGDVVTKMNGVDLFNANVANREIRKLKVGEKISLDVERKNGPAKVDLTVDPAQNIDLAGILKDLVNKQPSSARAYFLRAAYAQTDAKAALADYTKAIDLSPDFVSAYVQRGTLQENSNPDQAMKDFDKAISLDPNYEPAYVNRSVLLSSQKAYDKALADDKKAVGLDPTDPAAYTNLGIGFINKGDMSQAMTAENKALEIDPSFGPALVYRGLMYRDASKADLENATHLVRDAKLKSLAEDALKKMS